jgi:ribosomal protein S18 acetylase RimI-like enzyme
MTDIVHGLKDNHRAQAAQLYWAAFAAKLGKVLGPTERAEAFLCDVIDSSHVISAISQDGQLLGVAGFKTDSGAFVGGGIRDLMRHYGLFGTIWRVSLLAMLERKTAPGVLLMDGICVDSAARGQGVGTLLLNAIMDHAKGENLSSVRLDVIDNNPRARALYERLGFVPADTQSLGPLRHVFGFNSATEMRKSLDTS